LDLGIGLDLLIVLVTAIIGGMLARWLRLPVILGYLAGGIAIGPFGAGLVRDSATIESLANIGVVLLLFAIGLEFSLKELLKLGKVSVLGGLAQILLTAAVGYGLGAAIHLNTSAAIFFGFIISLSSTMVVLKMLMEKGELDTTHGRVLLGILLVQDLSVVPMMVAIPAVAGELGGLGAALGIAFGKAVGFLAVMLALGYWFIPWFLKKVAGQRSRELFLLTVIVLCLATAFGTYYVGLSAAFGAFVAGLLVSESSYARQAFADIVPLRDTFAALFFVSLGLVADRQYIFSHAGTIAVIAAVVLIIKFVISTGVTRIFGYSQKTVLMVGTGLISVGEFSFVLALMGKEAGIFSSDFYNLVVAVAIVTMFVSPFIFNLNSFLYRWLSQKHWFGRQLMTRPDPELNIQLSELSRHAVICGFGQVGQRIAAVLDKNNFSYLIIELDPTAIEKARNQGVSSIYGDASNPEILKHAKLDKARVLLSTIPDYVATELTVRNALKINPRLDIVARVHRDSDGEMLKDAGATELVLPFFEGSLEMIRHTLHRFGMSSTDIQYTLNRLREDQKEKKEKE
jgi:CPA2 family monovalent cation:H+ antiporter-2